jgi:hypothetical protein
MMPIRNMTIKPFDVKIIYEDGKEYKDTISVVNKTLAIDHAKAYARKAGFVGKIKKIEADEEEEVCVKNVKDKKNVIANVTKQEPNTSEPVVENASAEEESKSPTGSEEFPGFAV